MFIWKLILIENLHSSLSKQLWWTNSLAVHYIPGLRAIVQKCLQKGEELGAKSIAFPVIGTENLNYLPDVASRIMLEETTTAFAKLALYLKSGILDLLCSREIRH